MAKNADGDSPGVVIVNRWLGTAAVEEPLSEILERHTEAACGYWLTVRHSWSCAPLGNNGAQAQSGTGRASADTGRTRAAQAQTGTGRTRAAQAQAQC
ncbi:hypothetical protein NHF46_03770 [Arthrobacter alpinus]|nr:hypothetical protein [Arthrobacter alpinus]